MARYNVVQVFYYLNHYPITYRTAFVCISVIPIAEIVENKASSRHKDLWKNV